MSDVQNSQTEQDRLMDSLVADLQPVRPLASPWLRASVWLAIVLALAVGLASIANLPALEARIMATPDMWLSTLGSTLTVILAGFAAFQLSMPDRSPWWAALPIPGLALWLTASGLGCARNWLIPGTEDASLAETATCLRFIVGLSIPLSIAMFWGLRRGYTLYPTLTGAIAGLAVASAAATLLTFFHPFDASVTDLSVHLGAVLVVVIANRLLGGWIFARDQFRPASRRR